MKVTVLDPKHSLLQGSKTKARELRMMRMAQWRFRRLSARTL